MRACPGIFGRPTYGMCSGFAYSDGPNGSVKPADKAFPHDRAEPGHTKDTETIHETEDTQMITFKGTPLTLQGPPLRVGDPMPGFILTDTSLAEVRNTDLTGIRVFLTVPSLDTGVCDQEVRRFNEKAAELPGVTIVAVSLDLPFAQARWCGAGGIEAVRTLSDYKDRRFGLATGTYIEELALLARAVFVVDESNTVVYAEGVPEVSDHPDYEAVYQKLRELAG